VWGKSLACQELLPGVIKQLYPDVLIRGSWLFVIIDVIIVTVIVVVLIIFIVVVVIVIVVHCSC
jgi:hypothetical protein